MKNSPLLSVKIGEVFKRIWKKRQIERSTNCISNLTAALCAYSRTSHGSQPEIEQGCLVSVTLIGKVLFTSPYNYQSMGIQKNDLITVMGYSIPFVVTDAKSSRTLTVQPITSGAASDRQMLVPRTIISPLLFKLLYVTKTQWEALTSQTPPNILVGDYNKWEKVYDFIRENTPPPVILCCIFNGKKRYVYCETAVPTNACNKATKFKIVLKLHLFGIRLC